MIQVVTGVNRPFVLSFEDEAQHTSHKRYYLPTVEIKNYNVMIDGKKVFDQAVRNNLITYDNIKKFVQLVYDYDYTTGCLLNFNYFKKYKIIAIDLSKQQALDADPKTIHQITFTENIAGNPIANTTTFFNIEEAKETAFLFFIKNCESILIFFFALMENGSI